MKKFLLSIFCLVIMAATSSAETYTHTFEEGQLTAAGGTVTLSDIEWNASSATSIGWNSNGKGIQIGSGSNPNPSYSLTTSALSTCAIKSITVNSSTANGGDAKLTITVGDKVSEAYSLGTSDAAYTFDCNGAKGGITIKWEATAKAYYVNSISIEYTLDASMVTVPAPEFKTPVGIYADEVTVTAETTDQTAVLYYTLDGTEPSYEDYTNDTGTTKCSKYWVMYPKLTETTTIKVIAVIVDGDAVYKSETAEATYIVSRTMPYIPAFEITADKKYALFAADSVANYFFSKEAEGNLLTSGATTPNVNYIETTECNGFVFTAVDGGYAIQNHDGRYLVQSGNSFAFTDEKPGKDAAWDVSIDDADGIASIKNAAGYIICFSTESQTFGCFLPGETDGTHLLPQLYMQREYPTFTVTPAQGTTLERLSEIIVTCDEGIKASNLKVASEGAVTTFTVKQTNSNTLTLTAKKELTTINNVDLNITFTGDILLNPNGMNMSIPIPTRYGKKTLVSYKLTGDAPAATIDNIDPADGSVLEELTSVVFTFSYYMNASEDESLQPRLYLEGTTELIPVEYSTKPEDGVKTMTQGAIKATAPVTANGTYILEVPTGYFIDANNNAIEGVTLKYTVQNDTGIEEILGADVNSWTVYNVAGVKVLETTDAAKVKALTKGLYIINGVKSIVK